MAIQIKKALIEDVKIVAPLFNAYRIFYKQPSDEAAATQFITKRLQHNQSVIFIAFADNVAAGFCQLFPIFSSVGLRRTWLLNDLYVYENARGLGIASALLHSAKEWGVATNAIWLLLQTSADNVIAQAAYQKNGWQKVNDFFYELPLM